MCRLGAPAVLWWHHGQQRSHTEQVKDASGRWIDVFLQENEIALFLGATAERATGGLLKAAATRVVLHPQPLTVSSTACW